MSVIFSLGGGLRLVYLFVEGRKAKNLFPSCEGRQVVPKKNIIDLRLIFQSRLPLLCLAWLFSG